MYRSRDHKIEVLTGVALFSACSKRELERIASLADHLEVDQGTVLTKEGKPGGEAFVIASGTAEARIRGKKIATLDPGAMVGEMALLDKGPRSATVTALTKMDLLVLDPRSFWSLIEDVPSVSRKVMQALAHRLRDAEKAPTY